jgi:hypothetical protein
MPNATISYIDFMFDLLWVMANLLLEDFAVDSTREHQPLGMSFLQCLSLPLGLGVKI